MSENLGFLKSKFSIFTYRYSLIVNIENTDSSIAYGGTKPKFPKIDFHDLAAYIWMPAWAQAKLERAQRSYNETSRGMGFAAHAYAPRRVKNLDRERSERIQILGRVYRLGSIYRIQFLETREW